MDALANNILGWGAIVDLMLVGSILYLGFRMFKNPNRSIRQIAELEASLRSVLKEADLASKNLNEQLLRRQETLESLLLDMGGSEARLNRLLTAIEETKKMVDVSIGKAQKVVTELLPVAAKAQANSRQVIVDDAVAQIPIEESQRIEVRSEEKPITRSMLSKIDRQQLQVATAAQPAAKPWKVRPKASRVLPTRTRQVEVEEFEFEDEEEERESSALRQAIEKEISQQTRFSTAAASQNADPYDFAEKMLRSGKTIAHVAALTRLPVEELQVLARLISRADAPSLVSPISGSPQSNVGRDDPRLGALGPISRRVEVL